MNRIITFDFETRSAADLKRLGAYKYSLHPSTQMTCMAFKSREESHVILIPFEYMNLPWVKLGERTRRRWAAYIDGDYLFTAHNAGFERAIYENVLVARLGWPRIPFDRYRCTAAKAAACALPRSLEGAGSALKLTTQKDKAGYIAMMKTCKPTKEWSVWNKKGQLGIEPEMFLSPVKAPDVFDMLYHYCKQDVNAEEALDKALPDLTSSEQEIWQLNQAINWRGVAVDVPTIKKISTMMEAEGKVKLRELDTLTMGLVTKPGARKSILEFLALEGIELADIRAKTVDDILSDGKLSPDMKRLLEIRKMLSKTSTKKYQVMLDRACDDGRVRDVLLYHGASTGRESGTGLQPQNFPRPTITINVDKPYAAIENVIECDVEMLKILYGENLFYLFSSILRNAIIASPGREIFAADFSKIEVAVLWWLADNTPGIEVLKSGRDPYKYMAVANTGKRYDDISEDERQLGKAQVLGCGFGLGATKFQSTAWDMYRLRLTESQAKQAVNSYRKANAAVPALWRAYETAAIHAVEKGKVITHRCIFAIDGKFLTIMLPSGRKLRYLTPRITWREGAYGPQKTLEFQGMAPNKKDIRWERTWGGTLTENIVQAVARDLLMSAMLRLERVGYIALLSVHDEAITECKIGHGNLDEFKRIMCEMPAWGDRNLVLDAKAWYGPRYRK